MGHRWSNVVGCHENSTEQHTAQKQLLQGVIHVETDEPREKKCCRQNRYGNVPSNDFFDEHIGKTYQQGDSADFSQATSDVTQEHIGCRSFDGKPLFEQSQWGRSRFGIEVVRG